MKAIQAKGEFVYSNTFLVGIQLKSQKAWSDIEIKMVRIHLSNFFFVSPFTLQDDSQPIMCSYKLVTVRFDVWGLASRVESFVHNVSVTVQKSMHWKTDP